MGDIHIKMIEIAEELFSIKVVSGKGLPGLGGDANIMIKTHDDRKCVLKVNHDNASF